MCRRICFLLILLTLVAGCSESTTQRAQRLAPLLTQAGFHAVAATTPARLQTLSSMTPLKMNYVSRNGTASYWFSDPYVCHCIYVGSQRDYDAFEQLKQQESAEQAQMADQEKFDQFMASPAGQVFYAE